MNIYLKQFGVTLSNCMVGLAIMFEKAFYKDTLCIVPEKKVHLTIKDGETREVHCVRTRLEARKSTLKLQLQYLGNNLIQEKHVAFSFVLTTDA